MVFGREHHLACTISACRLSTSACPSSSSTTLYSAYAGAAAAVAQFFSENSKPGYPWEDYADLLQQLKTTPALIQAAAWINDFVQPHEKIVKVDQLDVADICKWPSQKALSAALHTIESKLLENDLRADHPQLASWFLSQKLRASNTFLHSIPSLPQ